MTATARADYHWGRGGPRLDVGCREVLLHLLCPTAACLLAACAPTPVGEGRLSESYESAGITRVILRAAAADAAKTEQAARAEPIAITGQATGGAEGYHAADPKWRETSAADWGLGFVALRSGTTVVISSKNEIDYIHHHYLIADIVLRLPPSIELVRHTRTLSGSGEADLSPP